MAGIVVLVYDVAGDGVRHVVDIPRRVGYSVFHVRAEAVFGLSHRKDTNPF